VFVLCLIKLFKVVLIVHRSFCVPSRDIYTTNANSTKYLGILTTLYYNNNKIIGVLIGTNKTPELPNILFLESDLTL